MAYKALHDMAPAYVSTLSPPLSTLLVILVFLLFLTFAKLISPSGPLHLSPLRHSSPRSLDRSLHQFTEVSNITANRLSLTNIFKTTPYLLTSHSLYPYFVLFVYIYLLVIFCVLHQMISFMGAKTWSVCLMLHLQPLE